MIHQPSALRILRESFGSQEFTARQAAKALSSTFTFKTSFVALSEMYKGKALSRIKKGVYVISERNRMEASGLTGLARPEIILPKGAYVTGTYALSVNLTPISSPRFLDVFVEPGDYPQSRIALEAKEAYPQPRVHPFATQNARPLERSIDGFPIPRAPEVAFVDLVKIASEKRRPISLEYEILPFIPQLVDQWAKVKAVASREQVQEYLEAIIDYVSLVATTTDHKDILLPKSRWNYQRDPSAPPKTLSFEGGKADENSVETARRTGVMVEANKEAAADILGSL